MANLVVTLGMGEIGRRYLEFSQPLMEAYAGRIGADFSVITKPEAGDPLMLNFEKFQIRNLFRRYRRILYLDADVVVMPGAPDIFRATPRDRFAAWDEGAMLSQTRWVRATQEVLGAVPEWRETYYNAGIFVAARCHAHLFEPITPGLAGKLPSAGGSGRYSDQSYLNWNLARTRTRCFPLTLAWNWNPLCGYVHPAAHFVHFFGTGFFEPKRDRQLPEQDAAEKRLRQMRNLVLSLDTEIDPAEPALDLCVTSPDVRSCVPLPRYPLPAGKYEVELRLQASAMPPTSPVRCRVFGKMREDRTVADWSWPTGELEVKRTVVTPEIDQPQFCFDSPEDATRVKSLKIRWLGPLPRANSFEWAKRRFQRSGARLQHVLARILRPRRRPLCKHDTVS